MTLRRRIRRFFALRLWWLGFLTARRGSDKHRLLCAARDLVGGYGKLTYAIVDPENEDGHDVSSYEDDINKYGRRWKYKRFGNSWIKDRWTTLEEDAERDEKACANYISKCSWEHCPK